MKTNSLATWLVLFLLTVSFLQGQEKEPAAAVPAPQKEHAWLEQLAGEWETTSEVVMDPSKPPVKVTGTESSRMLGGFWLLTNGKCDCDGVTVTSRLTLGFDPRKKKYIGTWVDSCTGYMWQYEGTVDESGKKLTLDTEGPDMMMTPGKLVKYKEVIELNGKDEKTFTSNIQDQDGKWTPFMTVHGKRKS